MKILVVCQYYKPEPFRISDICEALVSAGHEVTVITGVPNYPEGEVYPGYEKSWNRETVENGVRVHRCYTIPRKTGALYRMLNYVSFAWSSTRFLSSLEEKYDVVFVNQLSPVMMAEGALRYGRKQHRKVVLYCLDLWPESLNAGGIRNDSLIYKIFLHISQNIYRRADQILIASKGFAPYINDYLNVPAKCEYLPQYAETLFDDVLATEPHDPPYHFVFAGNIGEMQSVDTIIRAAQILKEDPRVIFDIVGEGSAYEKCTELAKELPNVIFHGRKDIAQMPEYYTMADGMIVSLRDNPAIANTLPGKVQSYMAAGRAVIGSIGGETAAVIKDAQCGICSPPEDHEALAKQILELLDNPEQLYQYGKNARIYYQNHFKKEAFLEKLVSVLKAKCNQN